MSTVVIAALVAMVIVLPLSGAMAEPKSPDSARSSVDLNVDLKIGHDGFRVGGTLLGLDAVYGAWLNGAVRPDGFTVDGRLQGNGPAFNFKLNADIANWLKRQFRVPDLFRAPESQ